jgi:dynactin complex subunit
MVKADCSLTVAVIPATSNLNELEPPSKPADVPASQEIYYSLDDIQPTASSSREQELSAELDRERAVIKVLQGQKVAIGKDLDYLSQMVDDLTDENERLKAKLESQKVT